jgi:glyoxylase-like metal-dependent hydrolase (beta-lactamase superfamily II)
VDDFPLHVEDEVFYNGFTAQSSFGGSSYFVQHPEGNWLIDSPRYVRHLVEYFDAMGGIATIFLTHRDDVADADRYAQRFASRRIIHDGDRRAQPDAETVLEGTDPIALGKDFLAIPTPGHTRGHCVLLYRSRFLFSGDHLWWSRGRQSLHASREVCWYSWPEQTASMEKLLDHDFEWVLPGHGERQRLGAQRMRSGLLGLIRRMRTPSP